MPGHEYSVGSLELTLTALGNFHRSKGLGIVVHTPEVQGIMQAVRREKSSPSDRPQSKSCITPRVLQLLLAFINNLATAEPESPHTHIYLRDEIDRKSVV